MFWAEFQTKCASESEKALSKEFQCFTLITCSRSTDSEVFGSIFYSCSFRLITAGFAPWEQKPELSKGQTPSVLCHVAVVSVCAQPWALCCRGWGCRWASPYLCSSSCIQLCSPGELHLFVGSKMRSMGGPQRGTGFGTCPKHCSEIRLVLQWLTFYWAAHVLPGW